MAWDRARLRHGLAAELLDHPAERRRLWREFSALESLVSAARPSSNRHRRPEIWRPLITSERGRR